MSVVIKPVGSKVYVIQAGVATVLTIEEAHGLNKDLVRSIEEATVSRVNKGESP